MEGTLLISKNVGKINPISSKEYAEAGGYAALGKVVAASGDIIVIISDSGLFGRGGAGYPTGTKWSLVRNIEADRKYVVCNADEGEPGTAKDRFILMGDPHSVIEGMSICGISTGAEKGYIYIRAEYPHAREILDKAIADARINGYLGTGILGSDFNFDIEVRSGQGSYICGEETALLESIEGNRGEPRVKPPF
ncbi:MAG: hypothetical protein HGA22_13060, partial [Clostridiales bacterium]|nr:hypothetical protein [Clostridiales bacterium]